jgi:hypothetical protein
MTRNHTTALPGPALILADGPAWTGFTDRELARAVRKYLQPASVAAMVRYWSRLGVGSYPALGVDRDHTAITSYPGPPAAPATAGDGDRAPGEADGR